MSWGARWHIVRGDLPIDPDIHTIVVPGALLAADEAEALEAWVGAGNKLIWHGADPMNWGQAYIRFLGAKPVDYRVARATRTEVFGDRWTFGTYPRQIRAELALESATVLARDDMDLPILLRNQVGDGCVIYSLPLVEESIADVADVRGLRDRWQKWYGTSCGCRFRCSGVFRR